MSDPVEELFDQYVAAFDAGEVDPNPFLDRVEGTDRAVLEQLIDGFLESDRPLPEWDREVFLASPAAGVSESIAVSLGGKSGQWPVFLPELRTERKILREEVVDRLADELDAEEEAEREKVRIYYHDMEMGSLPAAGVTDRVIEALGRIYGTGAEKIRRAGAALGPRKGFEGGPVFARHLSDVEFSETLEAGDETISRRAEVPDRIDRLFTEADR